MQYMSGALEQLLARYVSGSVSVATAVLVEAHLSLSQSNHSFVEALESMAGLTLEEASPSPLIHADAMFNAILASKDIEVAPHGFERFSNCIKGDIPNVLKSYLQMEMKNIPWRRRMPGFWEYDVPNIDEHASLIRVKAGQKMPKHTHNGQELTLVLQGSFMDETGTYTVGDIAIADENVDHQPIAGQGTECICFAVVDAPLKLTGPIGRLISPFIKH